MLEDVGDTFYGFKHIKYLKDLIWLLFYTFRDVSIFLGIEGYLYTCWDLRILAYFRHVCFLMFFKEIKQHLLELFVRMVCYYFLAYG